MPVKFGLWRLHGGEVVQVRTGAISSEERLEEIIEARVDILGLGNLLQIGRQLITDFGKRIDLLGIDREGDLYVIELKKDRTPRDVVAQSLEYGYWIQGLSFETVRELYAKHHGGDDFDSAFTTHFESDVPEAINTAHHLVVVATGIDASTEQIVDYVRGYGVPINVLFFEYLQDDDREYLARSWLTDPAVEPPSGAGGKKQAPWNGRDFFVAVVWAAIPSAWASTGARGYVGVGEVTAPAVRVDDFNVAVDGTELPILKAPLEAENMAEDAEDEDMSEYLVRVRWVDVRPREGAVWEKGMFANQNVVAKLRQPFTLQRLSEIFEVDETA